MARAAEVKEEWDVVGERSRDEVGEMCTRATRLLKACEGEELAAEGGHKEKVIEEEKAVKIKGTAAV